MSSHTLLQGIFPTQGLNPSLLHCRQILYYLRHQGSPKSYWGKKMNSWGIQLYWKEITCRIEHLTFSLSVCILTHTAAAAAAAKSLQSCLTLCDPIDGSPPGSPVPGILQARTLEWVAISFSNAWKWKVKEKSLSRVWLFATRWTEAYQAPPSMGFSRQEYWSWVPSPSPLTHTRIQEQIISYITKTIKL